MGFFKNNKLGEAALTAAKVADQMVTDKDLANKLKADMFIAAVRAKTVPLIDGIHKMGRQTLAMAQLVFYGWCLKNGYEITTELVTGVSGATALYTMMKGKGS